MFLNGYTAGIRRPTLTNLFNTVYIRLGTETVVLTKHTVLMVVTLFFLAQGMGVFKSGIGFGMGRAMCGC